MVELHEVKGSDWKSMADEYEKVTSLIAVAPISVMLSRANALSPFTDATGVLDNGCGPGPVMSRLLKEYEVPRDCELVCADFSEVMLEKAREVKEKAVREDEGSRWKGVEMIVQDAMDLSKVGEGSVSHVLAGWVYMLTSDPQKCLRESRRVLKDGGVLSCSSWQGSQWMELMGLMPQVRPDMKTPKLPEGWTDADGIKGELEKAGFRDVESHRVPVTMKYDKAEPLVDFFMTKFPHMRMILQEWSEEERKQLKQLMLEEMKKMCPTEPGELTGVSLVAVGRR